MCLKIWGKSGIIQAGAEELKKKKCAPKVCWLNLAQTGYKSERRNIVGHSCLTLLLH